MKLQKKNLRLFIISLLCSTFFLTSCGNLHTNAETPPLRETQFMMGTAITITLYDHQDQTLIDQAFHRIASIEDALSLNLENTLLDTVNDQSGIAPVAINDDMFKVISRGIYYSELTEGSFDITVGPLVKLWNIGFPEARVPSQSEIDAVLPLIDFTKVHLDTKNKTVFLENKGMKLDLGGIAKGYAADEVSLLLREAGVEHALIDLGGNIYALGKKPDDSMWKVGIQDPFNPRGQIIGSIPIANQSIVTSGIYERYLESNNETYHHILNPEDGYPFANEIAGVTILSEHSIDGDALSTSVFSKGIQEGLSFVNALDGIDAIFISRDSKIYLTAGIKDAFVLTNPNFTVVH